MTAEHMIRVWAAKKLDLDPDQVIKVTFDHEPECRYSTYTLEPESFGCVVKTWLGDRYIAHSEGWEGFADVLQEILEANQPPAPQAEALCQCPNWTQSMQGSCLVCGRRKA